VRRAICWNDQTLAKYHQLGLERIGGEERVQQLIQGAWAPRYTLSHLVKDEQVLAEEQWKQTHRILSHGSLAAGYLTGNFDVTSVSSAASTGIMNLRDRKWCREMLQAIGRSDYQDLAWQQLPRIVDQDEPVGRIEISLAEEFRLARGKSPVIFPTSDDQQAGLVGAGAVDSGQLAIILGTSAVVNSASADTPASSDLDVMRLNWGPYLWMRCYTNGAQFIEHVVGKSPDWEQLESLAAASAPAATQLNPFVFSEPSLGVSEPAFGWIGGEPSDPGQRYRAALEALAYLVALGVREHERAGQTASRITVSGGTSQSQLMCEILATLLDRPLERLQSTEGPALGAAVTALASYERLLRRERGLEEQFSTEAAVQILVNFSEPVLPNPAWKDTYARGLERFEREVLKRS
jgi:sugar (pentulose or hexulose) kinase